MSGLRGADPARAQEIKFQGSTVNVNVIPVIKTGARHHGSSTRIEAVCGCWECVPCLIRERNGYPQWKVSLTPLIVLFRDRCGASSTFPCRCMQDSACPYGVENMVNGDWVISHPRSNYIFLAKSPVSIDDSGSVFLTAIQGERRRGCHYGHIPHVLCWGSSRVIGPDFIVSGFGVFDDWRVRGNRLRDLLLVMENKLSKIPCWIKCFPSGSSTIYD